MGKARRKRDKGKTVYVLGAGASVEAGLPIQHFLLRDFLTIDTSDLDAEDRLEYKRVKRSIREFLRDFFFIPRSTNKHYWPSFEDILTVVDRAILNKESLSPNYSYHRLNEVRSDVSRLFRIVLLSKCRSASLDTSYLNRFLRRVDNELDTIISLNWDHLIDVELIKLNRRGIKLDYCTAVRGLGSDRDWSPVDPGDSSIRLLKLHGSINWFSCPNCGNLFTTRESVPSVTSKDCCRICEAAFDPILVTPSFIKDLNSLHLRSIWGRAGQELRQARRLVFVGYSFPEADFEFRYLLKKNFVSFKKKNRVSGGLVEIVDYSRNLCRSFTAEEYYKIRYKQKTTHYLYGDKIHEDKRNKLKVLYPTNQNIMRFMNFFGRDAIVRIHLDGFKAYIDRMSVKGL